MPISDSRTTEILRLSRSLWSDFLDSYEGRFDDQSLFRRGATTKEVNPAIKLFFRFCADLMAPSNAQNGVEANIVPRDLSRMADNSSGRPASWLMSIRSNGIDCPTILIDFDCLDQSLSMLDAVRARNHLTLHEVGHLILHGELLRDGMSEGASKYAKSAQPQHEEEAWWFCYALLGLAVANLAFKNKSMEANADDQIWRLWLR